MLTAIITYNGDETAFLATAKSFYKQKIGPAAPRRVTDLPQLIVLDKTGEAHSHANTAAFLAKHAHLYIDASRINLSRASNIAVSRATGLFTVFLNSGDIFSTSTLEMMFNYFKKNSEEFPFVCPDLSYYSINQKKYIPHFPPATPVAIDLETHPTLVPLAFHGILLKTSTLQENAFDESLPYDYGLHLICRLLKREPKFAWVKKATFKVSDSLEAPATASHSAMDKEWYWKNATDFLLQLMQSNMHTDLFSTQGVPTYLQHLASYQLKVRFRLNANNATKHVIDDEVDDYFRLCKQILQHIEPDVLLTANKTFALPQDLKDLFFRLKYDQRESCKDEGAGYTPNYFTYGDQSYLEQHGALVYKISGINLLLELLEFNAQHLIVEGSLDNYADFSRCKLNAFLDEMPIPVEETYRYAHTKYFGKSVHKRYTFRLKIPKDSFGKSLKLISFEVELPTGHKIVPPIVTKRYTSKLSSALPGSYWNADGYLLRFKNNKKAIKVVKATLFNSLKAEFRHMKGMVRWKKKSIEMLKLRGLYWLTYPYFRNKRIWLTYDKLYKGGDCGEYFYKYAFSRKAEGIKAVYVINKNSPDRERLKKEGFKPLVRGTIEHRLNFLHAEAVFTTHTGVYNFNSFTNDEIIALQDLLKFDVSCIQHGLTVQSLAFDSNRLHNNIKRYYCASKHEIKNLSKPIYGYEDKDMLKLTGIPRYDGLIDNNKRQILITPTWRNYIVMPPVMGSTRPYNKNFKETTYFKTYNRIISDDRIISSAKKYNYKLVYLLHPVISVQRNDYEVSDEVEIISALDVDYEKILTESSLMITDYSGVQFDFAYMRKPVIYYHPKELPPHYKEGGFFYDTMGFGEICETHEEIVDLICQYMENDCAIKPLYADRQNDFFAFDDLNSCQRIYDDMLEFQRIKRSAAKGLSTQSMKEVQR